MNYITKPQKEYKDKDSSIKDEVSSWLDDLEKKLNLTFLHILNVLFLKISYGNSLIIKILLLSNEAQEKVKKYREKSKIVKDKAGLSITIRKRDDDKSYLDMDNLANMVDKGNNELYRLSHKAKNL